MRISCAEYLDFAEGLSEITLLFPCLFWDPVEGTALYSCRAEFIAGLSFTHVKSVSPVL